MLFKLINRFSYKLNLDKKKLTNYTIGSFVLPL